jgi:glycosyltransferase involved in cell wall biosynthesis
MMLAWAFRKPLFVRYCGNWLRPTTIAERLWRRFMEIIAGGRNVMLATGGTAEPPSQSNPNVRWIFSSTLTAAEMEELRMRQPAFEPARLRLITVGRQQKGKGTDKLLEALPLIRQQIPQAQLDVVGDGSEVARLMRRAVELGVGGQVVFHGKLGHADVLRRLQQAHIFCFPTHSEGFPKAVLEAMSCGLPVIATPVSVLPMLLSTGGGTLVEPSAGALAGAVLEIANSKERFDTMSARAREMARDYTLERWRDNVGKSLSAAWGPLREQENPQSLRGLRVCLVAGTLGQGGAERQLFYILRALKAAGASARVLSLTQGEHWESQIRELGVEVMYVGESSSRWKRLLRIIREVRSFRPHIVQAQHFYVNLYAAAAARFCGCRAIGAVRNNVTSELADVGGPLGRAGLRLAPMLASNSRAALKTLVKMGVPEHKLFFLPNVVDNSFFAASPWPHSNPFVILGAGRLAPQKRFDLFLQVLAQVSKQRCVKGLIAGDGPLRAELEPLALRLGLLPKVVQFLGRVGDTSRLYGQADLLLLTSDHEGTPNVVLEAMASGVPVISTRVGDVPELLGQGDRGRLVAPGDVAGLVSATEELLSDPHARARLASQARSYVQSEHSSASLGAHLTKLYSTVLAA